MDQPSPGLGEARAVEGPAPSLVSSQRPECANGVQMGMRTLRLLVRAEEQGFFLLWFGECSYMSFQGHDESV